MSANLTFQYQLTSSMSVQAGYVTSLARHLESFPGANQVTQILPRSANADNFKPFKDFQRGSSYAATEGSSIYHGLQVTAEKRYATGLNFLGTYTWSKTRSDAGDLLNGGSLIGYRAPAVPGFGIQGDYGLADFDVRHVVHFSGGLQHPLGKGKRFPSQLGGGAEKTGGGWRRACGSTLPRGEPGR